MTCGGCAKRRDWIKRQVTNLIRPIGTKSATVHGIPVRLSFVGKTVTVFVKGEDIGTVADMSGVIRLVEVYKNR